MIAAAEQMGKKNNDIEKYKHIAQYIANLKRD